MLNVRRLIYKTRRDEMNSLIDLCVCDIENKLYEIGVITNKGAVKFLVDQCAIVEYYNKDYLDSGYRNGYFTYYAVNINSLNKKYLFFRRTQITIEDYDRIADRVFNLDINSTDITSKLTRYEREKQLLTHIFLYILPKHGLTLRTNQLVLSLEMLEGLETNSISLMEAEVGTGKTHAYIMAVIIHNLFNNIKQPTIISTSTIALQNAITEEYIPQISEILIEHKILQKPIRFVVRKGKSHYACDRRLKTFLSSVLDSNIKEDKALILELQNLSASGTTEIDLDAYHLTRYTKNRICVTNKCNNSCTHYNECRFIRFSSNCLENRCDFQIANHNYVFANILSKKPLLPEYKVVIFDEAHKLYEVAKQMYGCYFSDTDITHLEAYAAVYEEDSVIRMCKLMSGYNTKIFDELLENAPPHFEDNANGRTKVVFTRRCLSYMNCLADLLFDLHEDITTCGDSRFIVRGKNIQKICREIRMKINNFIQPNSSICWLEHNNKGSRLCSIPKELSKMIAEDIWKKEIPYILTSGTMSAGGDFGLIKNKTGIDLINPKRIRETSKPSPFDYKNNTLLYIPEHIPFPNLKNQQYLTSVAREIHRLLKVTYGHALVLFTSYWLMEKVLNEINRYQYEYPLFIMGRGRIDALKNFKISGNGVLFASDSAGEGVDIVGDTLSNLIIVKLPFAVPDPISEYEQSVLGGLDTYLDRINTPNMIIKLKQYAGRLIRSETDTGIVAILDSRVNSWGKYRDIVLDSLFDTTATNNIQDVIKFIQRKKDRFYFE